jgi:homoserine kinase
VPAARLATATAFAPGSIGNVGPGFDVLGLAVDGIGDTVTVELLGGGGESRVAAVTGRDAALVPRAVELNCAALAARALLRRRGLPDAVAVTLHKGLALAGGMGGSAASSVAGACAAHLAATAAAGGAPAAGGVAAGELARELMAAALAGEEVVSGRHLDNIAPQVLGGLALSRSVDPIDAVRLPVAEGWWVALVTPAVRIETKAARALLPEALPRREWVQQMANTVALAHALATADGALLGRALDDRHAEPIRGPLIPRFAAVKAAALSAGASGCSISGSGPTVFALALGEEAARRAAAAMQAAFGELDTAVHVGTVARTGVRPGAPEAGEDRR